MALDIRFKVPVQQIVILFLEAWKLKYEDKLIDSEATLCKCIKEEVG